MGKIDYMLCARDLHFIPAAHVYNVRFVTTRPNYFQNSHYFLIQLHCRVDKEAVDSQPRMRTTNTPTQMVSYLS